MTDDGVVQIRLADVTLEGQLLVPEYATGIAVFAHGSGSSRHSPRNNDVAEQIRTAGIGTLLFDLLTEAEDEHRENRFDIDLLTERLLGVTDWLQKRPEGEHRTIGYFGASTGAAAALRAAARRREDINAVVARGGRVDLAADAIADVRSPTLLVVGANDDAVLEHNQTVFASLRCEAELTIVENAGHLFEEPGALDVVADEAQAWFGEYL
jgi:dienelactone hydrolase